MPQVPEPVNKQRSYCYLRVTNQIPTPWHRTPTHTNALTICCLPH